MTEAQKNNELMRNLIAAFPENLTQALEIATNYPLTKSYPTFNNVVILSTWYFMWLDVNKNQIGHMYNIGYILSSSTFHNSALLGNALLGKICNENTRGTMFGFNGFFGSIGICVL